MLFFLGYPGLVPIKIIMMLLFVGVLSLILIDNGDVVVNLVKQSNNTISLFYIFGSSDVYLHTWACLPQF